MTRPIEDRMTVQFLLTVGRLVRRRSSRDIISTREWMQPIVLGRSKFTDLRRARDQLPTDWRQSFSENDPLASTPWHKKRAIIF